MRTALSNFTSSLQRVRDISLDISSSAHLALADPAIQRRHETIQCAATVILSGFFESFLKEVAEAFIRDVTARALPFVNLPASIRFAHYIDGAQILSKRGKDERAQRTGWIAATTDDIAQRIGSVASTPYELVWEAFADTRANPNSETVSAFLKRFDLSNVWALLSAQMGMSQNTIKTVLDSFISVRNECAHSGSALTIPTPSEVTGYCDFLEQLATAVVQVLEARLATL